MARRIIRIIRLALQRKKRGIRMEHVTDLAARPGRAAGPRYSL